MLQALREADIELFTLLAPRKYWGACPENLDAGFLKTYGVLSVSEIDPLDKLTVRLSDAEAVQGPSILELLVEYFPDNSAAAIQKQFEQNGIKIIRQNGANNFVRVALHTHRLLDLAALPFVASVDLAPAISIPDDRPGANMQRSNALDVGFSTGRHLDGLGVNVLVRDDGAVGPHIDLQGRLNNDNVNFQQGNHGDGVAGVIAGAGNLNPEAKGVAKGVQLFTLNYASDFLDETLELFQNQGCLITSTSYSESCNAGYTANAATVDQQLYLNPTLMHVFSAGNLNGTDCGYGAGTEWANITGGHKQAKNCITVANLEPNGGIAVSSSRGPAHDGRLKPDISAMGNGQVSTKENNAYQSFGGTSAAAPGISGLLAQLHQAYREQNNGSTGEAALLKACLLNTATDQGAPGPDFVYGWGRADGLRAVRTLEEDRYLKSIVSGGQTKQHNLTVPPNTVELRVMLYWVDRQASPLAQKALVNNLDLCVKNAAGSTFLPWVPIHLPDQLDTPAVIGIDTLNNVEQVVINNPAQGTYTVNVKGTDLPFGASSYFLVWEFRTAEIVVTHPIGGETFEPGDSVWVHWDAAGTHPNFQVSLSTNGGNSFFPISTVSGNARMALWTVPDNISGNALIRVGSGTNIGQSSTVFSIAPRPQNVEIVQACPDFIKVKWDPVDFSPASTSVGYEVFLMGEKYMELVATTNETYAEVPTFQSNPSLDHWIAVRANGTNGIFSKRTIAKQYNNGLLDCTQQQDIRVFSLLSPSENTYSACGSLVLPVKIAVQNNGLQTLENVPVGYQLGSGTVVSEVITGTISPGETVPYTFSIPLLVTQTEASVLKVFTLLATDQAMFNDVLAQPLQLNVYPGSGTALDYSEDFNSPAFPPVDFVLVNANQGVTWMPSTVMGANGSLSKTAWLDNYNNPAVGDLDELLLPLLDLTNETGPQLSFEVAYARHSEPYSDGLRVEVSTDCGASFSEVVYDKSGLDLATVADQLTPFMPTDPSHWRREKINLSMFIGEEILVRFVGVNGYGNSLFLENIEIENLSAPVAGFQASGTTVCEGGSVVFSSTSSGQDLDYQWDFGPGAVPPIWLGAGPIEVVFGEPGTNSIELTVSNAGGVSSDASTLPVNPLPVPAFSYEVDGTVVHFTNSSLFGESFFWIFGDGMGGIGENPSHAYTNIGAYHVILTATNACGSVDYAQTVYYGVSAAGIQPKGEPIQIYPNPNNGMFFVKSPNGYRWELSDVQGHLIESGVQQNTSNAIQVQVKTGGIYLFKLKNSDGLFSVTKMVVFP